MLRIGTALAIDFVGNCADGETSTRMEAKTLCIIRLAWLSLDIKERGQKLGVKIRGVCVI